MAERGRGKKEFDKDFKEQLKKEIKEELLFELKGKPIVLDYSKKDSEEKFTEEKYINEEDHKSKENKKPIKLLIFLVFFVLVLDILVVVYYNPGFFKSASGLVIKSNDSKNLNGDCSDGTRENTCSKTKPYYCLNEKLVEAGYTCGCPEGYIREFQSCKVKS
jgi:flagellar basal body-associated protein FliL